MRYRIFQGDLFAYSGDSVYMLDTQGQDSPNAWVWHVLPPGQALSLDVAIRTQEEERRKYEIGRIEALSYELDAYKKYVAHIVQLKADAFLTQPLPPIIIPAKE